MKHPERLIPEEDPFVTGEKSSYMTYEAIEKMTRGLAKGLEDQAIKDEEKGFVMLTKDGRNLAQRLEEAAEIAAKMWRYSKPRMNEEE